MYYSHSNSVNVLSKLLRPDSEQLILTKILMAGEVRKPKLIFSRAKLKLEQGVRPVHWTCSEENEFALKHRFKALVGNVLQFTKDQEELDFR